MVSFLRGRVYSVAAEACEWFLRARQAVTATLQDISIGQYVGSVALSTGAGKNPKRYSCNAQAVTATFQTVGQRGQTLLEVRYGQSFAESLYLNALSHWQIGFTFHKIAWL